MITTFLLLSLVFLFKLPFSIAEFPPPVLPNPLPMEKYQLDNGNGDAACPLSVDLIALGQARQTNLGKYSLLKEAQSFEEFEAGMKEIWDVEDEDIQVIVPAAGTYTGIEEVIEYISLVVGSLNNGFAYHYDSVISNLDYFPTNSSYAFQVAQKSQFYCTVLPSANGSGNCETGELESLSLHHVTWKPCTALIKQYVIAYDDQLYYLATKGASPVTICSRHERYCADDENNRQYDSFLDCMKFMESIPSVSCGAEIFNGDNVLCRFKHSFMTQFRPDVHCPHIGRETYACSDVGCDFITTSYRLGDGTQTLFRS